MTSSEKLDANVERRGNCVVVSIEDAHQEKAGIASLTCKLYSKSETSPPPPLSDDERQIEFEGSILAQLEEELAHKQELLEIARKYLRELKKRALKQGFSFLVRDQLEMTEYEQQEGLLKKEIADLAAKIRRERKLRATERPPHTLVGTSGE